MKTAETINQSIRRMKPLQTIELLAPAKNAEYGMAAIDHGADAVYIGAESFGARAAAGNPIEDIAMLCNYAHLFGARVYVTVNTIVYDEEVEKTAELLKKLREIHVDAVLVQDMAIMKLAEEGRVPPMVFHASTQTDNRTAEKVDWLHSMGFKRVVLARELSVEEIAAIHKAVPGAELEVFVHGALCVSYSGVCYASQHCFKRSANRGECAQFCRLSFDLKDADGHVIEKSRHLLSLKDMCQIDSLEKMMAAGATSFKIEGRLKDLAYVKNVTAAYSKRLDEIVKKNSQRYRRASSGQSNCLFTPNLEKTFHRGYTSYFLNGRQPHIFSPDTPKVMGEFVGKVKEIRTHSFNVAGTASFANGDGLCFINDRRELEGFRVNRAEGNRLFPLAMPKGLCSGTVLYRNNDQEFERLMKKQTAERKMALELTLVETESGFELRAGHISVHMEAEKQTAMKSQRENIERQLSKLGGTPYYCQAVHTVPENFRCFVPSSLLADIRRQLVEKLSRCRVADHVKALEKEMENALKTTETASLYKVVEIGEEYRKFPYLYNISNRLAERFYREKGMERAADAFELMSAASARDADEPLIMQCRHCIKYSLGYCTKKGGRQPQWREPLFLSLPDGRHFRLEFKCNECQMNVYGNQ